jgi:hypothetical protein
MERRPGGHSRTDGGTKMANLKIRVFKYGEATPATTVTIPARIIKLAYKFIPRKASQALQEQGMDLDELIRLSDNPEAIGTLVEIEDHRQNEKVVIGLE